MKEVKLTFDYKETAETLEGVLLDDSHYDMVISENCKVYKPDGALLLVFVKNAVPNNLGEVVMENLKSVNYDLSNRSIAVSKGTSALAEGSKTRRVEHSKLEELKKNRAGSGIIGYYDRYERYPFCRQTAYNNNSPQKFKAVYPLIKIIDDIYAENAPDHYQLQRAEADRTHPDFVINGTAFTTVTVNRNWRTATHRDAGDFEKGFGNICCLRKGKYIGGYTVFPRYRVAIDLQHCDVALMDVHELHGNTKIIGKEGQYTRTSLVCYYRKNMIRCKSAEEELRRAKIHGQKINLEL